MITRKISAVIRGKATPFQIVSACVLGALIGFTPTFATAGGLMIALFLLLLILNANLIVALATASAAKVLALLAVPVTFALGQFLLDGPTQPLFRSAVNAPVLALFGFEYYLTTGGIVMGLIFGAVVGFAIVRAVASFRKGMSKLETASPAYKKFTSKRSVRLLTFLLIGKGKGKTSYEDLITKRIGNPIRLVGAGAAVLVVVGLYFAQNALSERILTAALVRGLEQANGATVDLASAHLSLRDHKLTLASLAITDPDNLDTDLFRATTIQADLDTSDLLRKRLTLDHVGITDASNGSKRDRPGVLIKKASKPTPPAPAPGPAGSKQLDDYLVQAQKWKDRLERMKELLDRVQGSSEPGDPNQPTGTKSAPSADEIRRRIALLGHARVRADHLLEGAPMLLIRSLDAQGVRVESPTLPANARLFDIRAQNISTQPWLVEESADIQVVSRDKQIDLALSLAQPTVLVAKFTGLNADEVAAALSTPEPLMKGGTLDATLNATIGPGPLREIAAPMLVNLHNTRLALSGLGSTDVAEFSLPITVAGTLANPQILVDEDALATALADAGANELANALQKELNKALGDVLPDELGGDKVGDDLNKAANDLLKGVLGGGGE
jgi:uncharacterized protein (TIGR03546 family)